MYPEASEQQIAAKFRTDTRPEMPGVCRASRQFRAETRQIFCEENSFNLPIYNFTLQPHLGHWIWNLGNGQEACLHLKGVPSLHSLYSWLLQYWRDLSTPTITPWCETDDDYAGNRWMAIHAFQMVRRLSLAGTPWKTCLSVIRSLESATTLLNNEEVPWLNRETGEARLDQDREDLDYQEFVRAQKRGEDMEHWRRWYEISIK